ncbi:hypothetical protein BofuT4_P093060.1 [Botrytis cinerea T4]|uniref:Uncharacterized protein n=1 Tax=Botryotinia fuckeliana (strain T4) TaxID=999810 RepID=G2YE36_BOTF4|nr:hypothetical protein BofuT4_P093060.1 [Botrytis cinerea T4]
MGVLENEEFLFFVLMVADRRSMFDGEKIGIKKRVGIITAESSLAQFTGVAQPRNSIHKASQPSSVTSRFLNHITS